MLFSSSLTSPRPISRSQSRAISTLLGSVVAEHRSHQIKTRGLRAHAEPAFEIGPHDPGGGLRPQSEIAIPAVLETVELLDERVAVLARSLDELSRLDDRCDELLIAEPSRDDVGTLFGRAPVMHLRGEDVADSADGLDRLGSGH